MGTTENSVDQTAISVVRLQSRDHEEILNVIDQLRAEGISKYVNLPQLIVCGDQSSGKSSVLEAISGLDFPRKDNVCTRFATELILRRAPDTGVTISVYPDEERPPVEKERLRAFKSPTLALNRFGEIIKSVEDMIGVSKEGFLFSRDILRVEVSGPMQPHLTLVDLPGLYHASDELQNEDGVAFVESLVLSYMKNQRSVMLAVISAKNEIALQKVTAFTRRIDPNGERTLGIITKPDTLPNGSEMEGSFLNLAKNKRMPFRLGWHVLKNRTYEERSYSIQQRHDSETAFLSQGIWSTLPRAQVGIDTLRPRLSTILKDHILSQMSGLLAETRTASADAESSLRKLGQSRQTLSEQRRYLLYSSENFTALITAAINGIYLDPFFGDALDDDEYEKRLRAVVQNRLSDFSDTMSLRGEQRRIVADDDVSDDETRQITRSDFVDEVKHRMRRSRGRELPGTFNPLIIGELFFAHARPWKEIVYSSIDTMLEDVRRATTWILQEVLDDRSIEGLLKHVINPYLDSLKDALGAKAAELMRPHQTGHPITYNHYFTETIQATREEHARKANTAKLRKFFGSSYPQSSNIQSELFCTMDDLVAALSSQNDTDMERFACSEAIDCMLSYHKVARKRIVDDISSLAVEVCLLEPLLTMFCPRSVDALTDAVVDDIAKEDENTQIERDRLKKKVTSLRESLDKLQRLDLHNLTSQRASPSIEDSGTDAGSDVAAGSENAAVVDGSTTEEVLSLAEIPVEYEAVRAPIEAPEPEVIDAFDWAVPTKKLAPKKRHRSAGMWE